MIFPLVVYDKNHISKLVKVRNDETRLGECVQTIDPMLDLTSQLEKSTAKYVLLGLPEDVGVRANHGRGGAYSAWQPTLTTLLNTQSNQYLVGSEILILGHIDFTSAMLKYKDADFSDSNILKESRVTVASIDNSVADLIKIIVESGKEPIIIGGGHNNAYGCIKGSSLGLKNSKISVINCDAHSDFRPLEGRHSGNAFSYAYEEGFLNKYSMVGLHESFNTDAVIKKLIVNKDMHFTLFEDIFIREELSFKEAIFKAIDFSKDEIIGLELDLDTVQNIPSSAKTSSGISTIQARQYITQVAQNCDCVYFHLAEAAPVLSHIKTDLKTGKLLVYLISDYIKARNKKKTKS